MQVKLKYELKYNTVEELFEARGIKDGHRFLHPEERDLQPPNALDNMNEGVLMLTSHENNQTLLVVDSDADGFCSSTIIWSYLKQAYEQWHIEVILHENKGHGLSDIDGRVDLSDYDLVILPDAGTNDDKYFLEHSSVDFLVLDHHIRESNDQIPTNAVVINNQMSPDYNNKSLSGAGVTWQFCRELDRHLHKNYANDYIDLAAVSIIADVMDLTTPENRYIVNTGLQNIKNEFLKILIDNASFQLGGKDLVPMGIAFYITPNINAVCRMGTDAEKERMWWAFSNPHKQVDCHKRGVAKGTQVDVCVESARECTNIKARQKKAQEKMAELCAKKIMEGDLLENKILIIELDETFDDMPSELNGLTATKIANETGRPTLIGRVNDHNEMKGSIRGLTNIDMPPLKEFLDQSGLFTLLAGHNNAAGFCLPYHRLDAFHEWANKQLADVDLTDKTYEVDYLLRGGDPELSGIIYLADLLRGTYGQGFPEPLIAVQKMRCNRSHVQIMGKNADTVKISYDGVSFMFFRQTMEQVKAFTQYPHFTIDLVGTANLNEFRGNITPQLFVKDYEIKEDSLLDF